MWNKLYIKQQMLYISLYIKCLKQPKTKRWKYKLPEVGEWEAWIQFHFGKMEMSWDVRCVVCPTTCMPLISLKYTLKILKMANFVRYIIIHFLKWHQKVEVIRSINQRISFSLSPSKTMFQINPLIMKKRGKFGTWHFRKISRNHKCRESLFIEEILMFLPGRT